MEPPTTNTITSEYDAAGRLTSSTDSASNATTFDYDDRGRRVLTTYENGYQQATEYDNSGSPRVSYPPYAPYLAAGRRSVGLRPPHPRGGPLLRSSSRLDPPSGKLPPVALYPCPHLGREAILLPPAEEHILLQHPEFWPAHRDTLELVLRVPTMIRISDRRADTLLFSRWCPEVIRGKFVVVVVRREPDPTHPHLILSAYAARKLSGGRLLWMAS